ncbi:MAG: substrate-binding domain-containing protein [Candidatus Lokiarchaeota archaeon]|nr:substrate-binding domain-containing protein [Candidatus Lokiarchaeota archaeon]
MEKKNLSIVAVLGIVAFFFIGMGSGYAINLFTPAQTTTITITGSTTCEPVITDCANLYMQLNPNVQISVSGGGSSTGISNCIDGINDIGMASRNIKGTENVSAGNDLIDYQFAKDALAVIIDADHPDAASIIANGLTMLEVYMIYNGSYDDWSDLGYSAGAISPMTRDSNSGTRATFEELVVNLMDDELGDDAGYIANVGSYQSTTGNPDMVTQVAASTLGIGYCGLGFVDTRVLAVPIGASGSAVGPSATTALDGTYPISRSLHLVTNGAPSGEVQAFIDFVYGIYGQEIVIENGFIRIWN